MNNDTCTLSNCDRPLKRKGYCYAHYMKVWRYGTPYPVNGWMRGDKAQQSAVASRPRKDLTGQRFGTIVVVGRRDGRWVCICDCGRERLTKAGDINRSGDATTCGFRPNHRSDHAGYGAAHERVRTDRGPISTHTCRDCGDEARHWSYDHDDPNELIAYGLSANGIAYSLDPKHYSPRCVPCHKRYDLDRHDSHHCEAFIH